MKILKSNVCISIVVVTYKMSRELPRTIYTCSHPFQKNLENISTEIIVANNDADDYFDLKSLPSGVNAVVNTREKTKSPVNILNRAIDIAKGEYLIVIVDGARMLSPLVISNTYNTLKQFKNTLVTPLAFHLGPKHQSISVKQGYCQEIEDQNLARINWSVHGNNLFKISSLAGSNPDGFFGSINESCAIGISKRNWKKLNGFSKDFKSAGGGLASLDFFKRAIEVKNMNVAVLLNGGSFHQLHGGASTSPNAPHAIWNEEYKNIRGKSYSPPSFRPFYVGELLEEAMDFYKKPPT